MLSISWTSHGLILPKQSYNLWLFSILIWTFLAFSPPQDYILEYAVQVTAISSGAADYIPHMANTEVGKQASTIQCLCKCTRTSDRCLVNGHDFDYSSATSMQKQSQWSLHHCIKTRYHLLGNRRTSHFILACSCWNLGISCDNLSIHCLLDNEISGLAPLRRRHWNHGKIQILICSFPTRTLLLWTHTMCSQFDRSSDSSCIGFYASITSRYHGYCDLLETHCADTFVALAIGGRKLQWSGIVCRSFDSLTLSITLVEYQSRRDIDIRSNSLVFCDGCFAFGGHVCSSGCSICKTSSSEQICGLFVSPQGRSRSPMSFLQTCGKEVCEDQYLFRFGWVGWFVTNFRCRPRWHEVFGGGLDVRTFEPDVVCWRDRIRTQKQGSHHPTVLWWLRVPGPWQHWCYWIRLDRGAAIDFDQPWHLHGWYQGGQTAKADGIRSRLSQSFSYSLIHRQHRQA